MIRISEAMFNNGNETQILEEKEKLLRNLHRFMGDLCLKKEQKTFIGNISVYYVCKKLTLQNLLIILDFLDLYNFTIKIFIWELYHEPLQYCHGEENENNEFLASTVTFTICGVKISFPTVLSLLQCYVKIFSN